MPSHSLKRQWAMAQDVESYTTEIHPLALPGWALIVAEHEDQCHARLSLVAGEDPGDSENLGDWDNDPGCVVPARIEAESIRHVVWHSVTGISPGPGCQGPDCHQRGF